MLPGATASALWHAPLTRARRVFPNILPCRLPVGPAATRDRAVSASDIGAVVARYGATGDPGGDPLAPPPPTGYHTAFDRGGAIPGANVWNLQPANGQISGGDIGAVVAQYGHSCL
jgi:hypothetical protein